MTRPEIKETLALGGIAIEAKDVTLIEVAGYAIAAVDIRNGGEGRFVRDFNECFASEPPCPQRAIVSQHHHILPSGLNQVFVLCEAQPEDLTDFLEKHFDKSATITNQSDGWVIFNLSGIGVDKVLERLAMIDMSEENFPVNYTARTLFQHSDVIICRQRNTNKAKQFIILTPRSAARGLLHAITQSPPFSP